MAAQSTRCFLHNLIGTACAALALLPHIAHVPPATADGPHHVGIVVDFGAGNVVTRCVPFTSSSINGMTALQAASTAGETFAVQTSFGGAVVCGIDGVGCPGTSCWCQCPVVDENCTYWTYWHLQTGTWGASGGGAGGYTLSPGDIDGWKWGHPAPPYGDGEPPPVFEIEDICAGHLSQTVPRTLTVTQSCGVLSVWAGYSDDVNDNGSAALTYTHTISPVVQGFISSMGKNPSALTYSATVPITTSGTYSVEVVCADPDGVLGDAHLRDTVSIVVPQAGFTVSPARPISGSLTSFVDTSTGGEIADWEWDFGDGSAIARVQNPTHTYTMAGTVGVSMSCTIGDCGIYSAHRRLSVGEGAYCFLPVILRRFLQ